MVSGFLTSPRLHDRMVSDEATVMRTWSKCVKDAGTNGAERIVLDRHFEAIGGLRGALSQHADEAYRERLRAALERTE